jgi:hypothetical protein
MMKKAYISMYEKSVLKIGCAENEVPIYYWGGRGCNCPVEGLPPAVPEGIICYSTTNLIHNLNFKKKFKFQNPPFFFSCPIYLTFLYS